MSAGRLSPTERPTPKYKVTTAAGHARGRASGTDAWVLRRAPFVCLHPTPTFLRYSLVRSAAPFIPLAARAQEGRRPLTPLDKSNAFNDGEFPAAPLDPELGEAKAGDGLALSLIHI